MQATLQVYGDGSYYQMMVVQMEKDVEEEMDNEMDVGGGYAKVDGYCGGEPK